MPSNLDEILANMRKADGTAAIEASRRLQRRVAQVLLEELAKFTPVDTGRLAGNYYVTNSKYSSVFLENNFNKSHRISGSNQVDLLVIDGKQTVRIVNNTPYAHIVNATSRNNSKYFERALLSAQLILKSEGITIELP